MKQTTNKFFRSFRSRWELYDIYTCSKNKKKMHHFRCRWHFSHRNKCILQIKKRNMSDHKRIFYFEHRQRSERDVVDLNRMPDDTSNCRWRQQTQQPLLQQQQQPSRQTKKNNIWKQQGGETKCVVLYRAQLACCAPLAGDRYIHILLHYLCIIWKVQFHFHFKCIRVIYFLAGGNYSMLQKINDAHSLCIYLYKYSYGEHACRLGFFSAQQGVTQFAKGKRKNKNTHSVFSIIKWIYVYFGYIQFNLSFETNMCKNIHQLIYLIWFALIRFNWLHLYIWYVLHMNWYAN